MTASLRPSGRVPVPELNPNRYVRSAPAGGLPKIEFSGVTKAFTVEGRTLTAVDDVSFTVETGTTHALVGESGSGKTTTIRLLLGLEEPDAGRITVAGEEITDRSHTISARSVAAYDWSTRTPSHPWIHCGQSSA